MRRAVRTAEILAIAACLAIAGCADRRAPTPAQGSASASAQPAVAAPPATPQAGWPAIVPALLAKVPDHVDDVFVERNETLARLREDVVGESLTALAALVWTHLPIPDEPIFASVIHANHGLLYDRKAEGDHGFVVWYEGLGTTLEGALPRAYGAGISPAAYGGGSGCVEGEPARDVRGVKVHGDPDSLFVSICLPDDLALTSVGELYDGLVEAVARKRFGASPAAALVGRVPDDAWAVAAWSHPRANVQSGRIVARDLGQRTTIELQLHATRDPQALVARIAKAHARLGLAWLAAIAPVVDGTTVTVTYELDARRHADLWAQVPDRLTGAAVLDARPAELRTLGVP